MSITQFDPELQSPGTPFVGSVTSVVLKDGDFDPNKVLDPNLPCSITVDWQIEGWLTPIMSNNGSWKVDIVIESLGAGAEGTLATALVPVGPLVGTGPHTYTHTVNVTPAAAGFGDALYELAVLVRHDVATSPVAGFHRGPVFELRTP